MRSPDTELRIPIGDITGDISSFTKAVMNLPSQGRRISRLRFEPHPAEPRSGFAVIETTTSEATLDRPNAIFEGISREEYRRQSR